MKWILVSIIALVLQQFLPWWSIAIAGFVFGLIIDQTSRRAFLNGFLGIFIFWNGIIIYVYIVNDAVLAQRLANMMSIPHSSIMIFLPGIAGGIIAGMAALSGRYTRVLSGWRFIDG